MGRASCNLSVDCATHAPPLVCSAFLSPLLCAAQHPWLRSQGVAADKPLDSVVLQRMRKLSATNKLKKAALVVMAKSLNPDEINGLQQLFRNIDADNSGTITIDELRTALTSCNGKMSVGSLCVFDRVLGVLAEE